MVAPPPTEAPDPLSYSLEEALGSQGFAVHAWVQFGEPTDHARAAQRAAQAAS